ncbi:MAG: SRPBCC family protein [Planctomycetota bacterium]
MEGTYSIEVEKPRSEVFAFLTDDENLPRIVPNLADHGVIEDKPGKVGSTFWHEYEEHGRRMKMTGVVTEYREPERWAVEMDGAMFGLEVAYTLDELGPSSTRINQYSKARFKHIFKLMGLLFGKKMKADGEKVQAENFARMKEMIESP